MSLKGSLKDIEEDLGVIVCREPPSADVRPEREGVEVVDREDWCWSKSAAAKISAEAMTRRSEDVYICSKTGKLGGHILSFSSVEAYLDIVEDIFICALVQR